MKRFPIDLEVVGVTWDSMSFQNIDLSKQVEIPVGGHCGAFGAIRRHDIHKGVDLYCPEGTPVFSIESGVVVDVRWFTGSKANCAWWEDTQAVTIQGESGNVVYGEITPDENIVVGSQVDCGDKIGTVKQVLTVDKGRPMSMLHFALHRDGVLRNGVWELGEPQPVGLLDPTNLLIKCAFNQVKKEEPVLVYREKRGTFFRGKNK